MRKPGLTDLARISVEAAHAAGAVLERYYGKSLRRMGVKEKKDAGLVTKADFGAERAAVGHLKKHYPYFGFLTEENPPEVAKSPGLFILDPLDGTTNFVHGFPMFCVSLAAAWEKEVIVGVIYHPILKDTYVAIRGKGATLNGKKIHVSRTARLSDSLLTTGFTYRSKTQHATLQTEMDAFERLVALTRAIRRPGSAALDLAYTARGVFDGFWERNLSSWDIAAGMLLVKEAGGKVTDFKGRKLRLNSREILACTPKVQRPLLQAIAPKFCHFPRSN